ncbi:restriction endonuclease subunit S [Streptosporangium roseum]|uniref:restriction endonuclease subunit S n=1 Tax=Streptosporangium roseum TaxID=2001 RepID=UPI00146A1BCC|nr:restriction endonuclease subunit S [Streptosporangium roseum]
MELSKVGVQVHDCEHRTPPEAETGYPYIAIPNIVDGRLDLTQVRLISTSDLEEWNRRTKPIADDVIITRRGRVGDSAVIPDDLECAIGQNLVILRSSGMDVNQKYLRWAVRGKYWESEVERLINVGSIFDSLNVRDIARMRIPVPPMQFQLVIAEVLGALDDKIAANKRTAATALELASAKYSAAAAMSADWCTVTLDAAARWLSGGTPKTSEPDYWNGDIPWISALSLKSPWIDDSDRKLTEVGARSGTRIVPSGSVIFVVRGSSLKTEFRVGITQREVAFGQDCKALIAAESIDSHVLFHAIRSRTPEIMAMVDETSIGAGRLSTDLISKLDIRVPKHQKNKTADELRSLDEVAARCQKESRILAALRDTLLPQLMSGKLCVRDAEQIVEDAL